MLAIHGFNRLLSNAPFKGAAMLILASLILFCCPGDSYSRRRITRQSETKREQPSPPNPDHQHSPTPDVSSNNKGAAKMVIPDPEVFNQDGKRIRFYSDLVKGRITVVSFIFTTCTYVCPMQGESLAKLQTALGDRLGKDVNIISITVDPETDTPERLKAWGRRFGAKPGWTLVTGEKKEIAMIIKAFTGGGVGKGEHSPIIYVGNDDKGQWIRAYGLVEPNRFISMIDTLVKGRPANSGQK